MATIMPAPSNSPPPQPQPQHQIMSCGDSPNTIVAENWCLTQIKGMLFSHISNIDNTQITTAILTSIFLHSSKKLTHLNL